MVSNFFSRLKGRSPSEYLGLLKACFYASSTKGLYGKIAPDTPPHEAIETGDGITFREMALDDLDGLVNAWPPEFTQRKHLDVFLKERLTEAAWKGFVALDGDGIVGAMWCSPWKCDSQTPLIWAGRNGYEITNLFVTPAARGKALATRLILYSMEIMKSRYGQNTAFSLILPERKGSIIAHERAGFESLGSLTSGRKLGRFFCRHVPDKVDIDRTDLPPAVILPGAVGNVLDHVRSLRSRGVRTHVLDAAGHASVYRASRYCTSVTTLPAEATLAEHAQNMIAWAREKQLPTKPVLLPCSDLMANVLAEHRDALSEYFIVGIGPSQPIRDMIDKARAHELAEAAGLSVPASAFVYTAEELQTIADTMPFPVMMKPISWQTRGETTFKAEQIDTPEKLLADGGEFIRQGASLTIQQFIPGGDPTVECYMFHRSVSGEIYAEATATKVYQSPPGRGIMAVGKAEPLPNVVRESRKLLKAIGYTGLGGIEFKHHEGKEYFIEVSVRPEGFQPLARVSGIDLPWLAYCDFIGQPIPAHQVQKSGYWIDELRAIGLVRYVNVFAVVGTMIKLLFRRRVRRAVWSWRDPLPFVAFWCKQLGRVGRLFGGKKKAH